jgi:hypothetical protein
MWPIVKIVGVVAYTQQYLYTVNHWTSPYSGRWVGKEKQADCTSPPETANTEMKKKS